MGLEREFKETLLSSSPPPPPVPLYLPVELMFAFPVRPAEEDADDDVKSSSCLVNNFQEDAASLV